MIEINNGFKTIQFALFFTDIDNKDTRVYRFLLSKLLTSHTKKYPTKLLMHKRLEDLYGANLSSRIERHANLNVLSIVFTMVDPLIVKDENLLNMGIELLNDVFYEREYFNEEIFEEEKRLLIEQWESLKDNRRVYANFEFNKIFFEKDLYADPLSGSLRDIKKVTLDDIKNYYINYFFKQDIKVIVNGHVENHFDHIKSNLKIEEHTHNYQAELSFREPRKTVHKEEITKMNQAILKLGYIMPVFRYDELYEAALCFDVILGGYPESRLFREIREKQGLCYDVSSNYDFYKGVCVISSGVAKDKKDYALAEIKKLVEDFKVNSISEDELKHAKSFITHQIKSSLDHQSYLTRSAFIRLILKTDMTIEQRLIRIEEVTLDQVNKVMEMISLDTTYALYGGIQ